ncbi:hypothetical protein NP493_277g00013 [Ridgeia piscesae]|uniref:asparaginase n=1 Tax=Ridgeia piscesae TaxID=27915 RepID=A0AAD9NXB6_RIDPI|nr:hypothetical protein NP493_277g00013 [Ridgeia piscesae]
MSDVEMNDGAGTAAVTRSNNGRMLAQTGKRLSVDSSLIGPPMDPSYQPKILRQCSQSAKTIDYLDQELEPAPLSKLLVIYTGGTIGMKSSGGVYSPKPDYLVPMLRKLPMFHDASYPLLQKHNKKMSELPLVMPQSTEGRRIIYCVYEYDPLLDSSNMTVDDYAQMALDIKTNYDHFDGFVILHGTDTMSYTASALSFMLENLGKPVILTGSQIPIFETRSDGRDNFLGALIMAGHYTIPEVAIYFHNALLRGNRSTKKDTGALDAFNSPNVAPLAVTEVNIHVNWNAVFRQGGIKKFAVHLDMCREVGVLRMFPSITLTTVKQFLMPPMRGVVLQSYGAGNGPSTRQDLMDVLREASDRGVLIVNITQCSRGMVSTSYESGKSGVIPGSDMTVEAALMKLAYILSKNEWSLEKKRKLVSINMRGELTVTAEEEKDLLEYSLIQKMAKMMKISSAEEARLLRDAIFPSLLCSAARQGNIDMLKELREAGADLSLGDYDSRTALHIATCEGHIEVVRYMLEYGASVHVRDRYGHSPLDDAIFFHRNDIIKVLRDTGAHLRLAPARLGMGDYDRRTPYTWAASLGFEVMVRYLLDHGADPHSVDAFGQTPIDEARKKNHTNVLKLLEESNPSRNATNYVE